MHQQILPIIRAKIQKKISYPHKLFRSNSNVIKNVTQEIENFPDSPLN